MRLGDRSKRKATKGVKKSAKGGAKAVKAKKRATKPVVRKKVRKKAKKPAVAAAKRAVARVPAIRIEVRELDPILKCGQETSVQFLYRVIERREGQPATNHLVFFDRHGWYCEHGPTCTAVAHAKKASPAMARAS